MKPLIHSKSSVRKYDGVIEEYAICSWGDGGLYRYFKDVDKDTLPSEERQKEIHTICSTVLKMLQSIPSDVFENIWGDHVYVTVTKDGMSVNEYDHE